MWIVFGTSIASDLGAGSVDGPGRPDRGTRLRMAFEEAVGAMG